MEYSPPRKRPPKHFSVEEKDVVLNIFKTSFDQPGTSKVDSVETTIKAAGITTRSVYNILKEYSTDQQFNSPTKYQRKRGVLDTVDEEMKNRIRKIVHSFYFKNEPSSVQKILTAVHETENLPNFKTTTFRMILKELNFRYQKRNRNSILKEKEEIIAWRRRYLRQTMQFRLEGRPIYYLDETWVNAGHTVGKVWTDKSVLTARQAFIEGLSTGLKNPSGKGKRLIIVHIGSDEGFVDKGLLLFESKKTGDYHEDMNAAKFEEWLQQTLPYLREDSVIVLDNAPYHSRKLNKRPTSSTPKKEIQEWLKKNNIPYEEDMVKAELLILLKEKCTGADRYAVDELILNSNRKVLRLPPYHCEMNPIELIWAQVKGYVARNNTTFKLLDVKNLFQKAIENTTPVNWENAVKHVLGAEKKMWDLDNIIDKYIEPIIITGSDDSSKWSDEDD